MASKPTCQLLLRNCRSSPSLSIRSASKPIAATLSPKSLSQSRSYARDTPFQVESHTPRWQRPLKESPHEEGFVPQQWRRTPPGMAAPVSTNIRTKNSIWEVNEDPRKLDDAYIRMLGHGGEKMLQEDVKWLAVTHKSFDHGRRGQNSRLAFLGKRIIDLQASLYLLNTQVQPTIADPHGREPFQHPALTGLSKLTDETKNAVVGHTKLCSIASMYGLLPVTRWKPRIVDDLIISGCDVVVAQTLCAIIGALSLEKGGEVANNVVREKILDPMRIL